MNRARFDAAPGSGFLPAFIEGQAVIIQPRRLASVGASVKVDYRGSVREGCQSNAYQINLLPIKFVPNSHHRFRYWSDQVCNPDTRITFREQHLQQWFMP